MPRGVKGSGKSAGATKVTGEKKMGNAKTSTAAKVAPAPKMTQTRKAYPSHEERIAMADRQIERLTKLSAARASLIEKTEKTLNERKVALERCTTALEKVQKKRERLVVAVSKSAPQPKVKLTAEERKARMAAGRAAKKAQSEKYLELIAALKDSGKSLDDLLEELKN